MTTRKRLVTVLLVVMGLMSAAAYGADITIGPVLELPGPDTMTVMWETDVRSSGYLIYRDRSGMQIEAGSKGSGTHHEVKLAGLVPDTRYDYRVVIDGTVAHTAYFTTLPEKGPYRVIFIGDTRYNGGVTAELFSRIDEYDPAFIVCLGDFVIRDDIISDWKAQFFDTGKDLFDHIPLLGVPGNHDLEHDKAGTLFRRFFPRPPGGGGDSSLSFARNIRGDLFIFLDIYSKRPFFLFTDGLWLYRTIREASERSGVRHIFVVSHEGVTSYWRFRRGYSGLKPFTGVMARNGVTAVISGHDHHYIRGTTYSGVPFFITGGGGSPLYDINEYNPYAALTGKKEFGMKVHHFLVMDVDGDRCIFSAVDSRGAVIDMKTISGRRRP